MKFIKGVMIGGLLTTGLVMLYTETGMMNKKNMVKKGKQMAKKIGIMQQKLVFNLRKILKLNTNFLQMDKYADFKFLSIVMMLLMSAFVLLLLKKFFEF